MKDHKLVKRALKHPEQYSVWEFEWLKSWLREFKAARAANKKKKK